MSVSYYNKDTGELVPIAGGLLYADAPVGSIQAYGGATAPSGWLLCQGQAVSKTEYSELYNVIGDSFGTASGSGMFKLPDLRESVPKGAGLTGHTVGAHLDADGLAVGEFLDDRIGTNNRDIYSSKSSAGNTIQAGSGNWGEFKTYRSGATTEVKAVGVNYIIKAKQVAVPADFKDAIDDAISAIKDGTNIDSFADVESAISAVDGKIAFPTISSGNPADIKGLNAQVSKSSNYAVITLLTSSFSSDADKTTIEWDGNNGVVRFRNYINNTKVKEATFMSSDKKYSLVSLDSTYYANTDWNIVKQGNICVMNMRNLKDIPSGETVIGTIPVGFRPELPFYEFAYIVFNNVHLGFRIGENGEIICANNTGAAISGVVYVNRNVTYFTA